MPESDLLGAEPATVLARRLAMADTLPDPEALTAANADGVTAQLQAFAQLYADLSEDEQGQDEVCDLLILRQSGVSRGSTMTGKVYNNPTLTTDATVPQNATLTIPENISLTLTQGMTLTNSGTIYVDTVLTCGGEGYGALTNGDGGKLYCLLAIEGGSATDGTATYNGKTYAEANASVTFTFTVADKGPDVQ